ncbi:unnamed protein product [Arabidopsis lyrata]|nr:unnamed protein product [Arabidopsis lyrata]
MIRALEVLYSLQIFPMMMLNSLRQQDSKLQNFHCSLYPSKTPFSLQRMQS